MSPSSQAPDQWKTNPGGTASEIGGPPSRGNQQRLAGRIPHRDGVHRASEAEQGGRHVKDGGRQHEDDKIAGEHHVVDKGQVAHGQRPRAQVSCRTHGVDQQPVGGAIGGAEVPQLAGLRADGGVGGEGELGSDDALQEARTLQSTVVAEAVERLQGVWIEAVRQAAFPQG